MADKKNDSKAFVPILFVIAGIGVALIAVAFKIYFSHFDGDYHVSQSAWGQFGDFMGGTLNPPLAFLALIALLYTIYQQRLELRYTRNELEKSTQALEKQVEATKHQNFEATFFNLITLFNTLSNDIEHSTPTRGSGQTAHGRGNRAWTLAYEQTMTRSYLLHCNEHLGPIQFISAFRTACTEAFNDLDADIGHCVNLIKEMLINILAYSDTDRQAHYVNILRTQLTFYPLSLLAYYCFTETHGKHFTSLALITGLFRGRELSLIDDSLQTVFSEVLHYPEPESTGFFVRGS